MIARQLMVVGALALGACSGDGASGGGPNDGDGNEGTCDLAITLSGATSFHSELDDPMTCIGSGSYEAYNPTPSDPELAYVELSFASLASEQTGAGIGLTMLIAHSDGTEFAPMGCTIEVTTNELEEASEFGDRYRVVGNGSCVAPAVSGSRSVEVVGTFRFVATVHLAN